jgi:serine/threonine protein kinase/predicted Zn-dependent protease
MRERELFIEALELADSAERRERLEADCADDVALRRRVLQLLEVHEKPETFFLDSPPLAAASPNIDLTAEGPGTVIGAYTLLSVIGEGGMGVVYLAEQTEPVRRKVALKVIKPGMDTRQVIARFEAERQALALMEHPNIALVLDAGTTGPIGQKLRLSGGLSESGADALPYGRWEGRPYFVMELVRGLPITEYCDECRASVPERLELFVHVCQAVQHAHQKGIIHRDIKPTNVLVTEHDGTAVVKVIDFGIAKAVGQRLTEQTLSTGFAQMIGTPLYMSPEQADLSGLDVDTRSDIYSLGVLLYELLTGTTPVDKERLKTAGFDEIRRIIREEEPLRPSSRMSTLDQAATTASQRRGREPRELRRLLQGELDWIVAKSLEKERNRRYDTASELALDIQRYLRDEPVRACPPSAVYRVRKLAWRNRLPLALFGLGMAVLLLAVVGLTIGIVAVDRERTEAMRQRDDAQTQRRLARRAVDAMYTQVAEKWLSQQPHLETLQREFLEKALQLYQESGEERGADPELRLETGYAYRRITDIQEKLGKPEQAEEAITRAITLLRALTADFPREPRYREALASFVHKRGGVHYRYHRFEPAEREFQESLVLYETLLAENPNDANSQKGRVFGLMGLASAWLGEGRAREAVECYRRALSLVQALPPDLAGLAECRRTRAQCTLNLGQALANQGQPREAEALCREAVSLLERDVKDFPRDPSARHMLAWSYFSLRQQLSERFSPEAETLLRQGFLIEAALRDGYPSTIDYQHIAVLCQASLSEWLKEKGRLGEADEASRQAFAQFENLVGDCPTLPEYGLELMEIWLVLRQSLLESGRFGETEIALRKTLAQAERLAKESPHVDRFRHLVALCRHTLGIVLGEVCRPEEAETGFREAIAIWSELRRETPAHEEYRVWLAWCYNDLADLFATSPEESFRDAMQAVQIARKAVETHPDYAAFWNTLGIAHYRAGDHTAAVQELEKSMAMNHGGDCYDWFFLAMAHHQLNQEEKAREFYERATSWLEQNKSALEKNRLQASRFRRFRAEAKRLLGPPGDFRPSPHTTPGPKKAPARR